MAYIHRPIKVSINNYMNIEVQLVSAHLLLLCIALSRDLTWALECLLQVPHPLACQVLFGEEGRSPRGLK